MLRIIIEVDAPPGHAIGVKESLAMAAERYGDTKVISVVEVLPEQLRIIIEVDAPPGQAIGVKEDMAMAAERYGDTKVISVVEVLPEQMKLNM